MAEKKIVFIVNPTSGTSGKKTILKLVEKNLDNEKFDYEILYTEYRGHASEIATKAVNDGVDIVCAIGGDGTVNEVARSLVHTGTAMAIIPSGSGNGLARHLHIPVDPKRAIKTLNECNIMAMDYGRINEHPFFCTCGVGFDAFISMKFAKAGKRGPITYMENVLKNGLKYNPETYEIRVEGTPEGEKYDEVYKAFLISCANASQYGNNAYIAPFASVRDGYMDVTILEPFNTIESAQVMIQLMTGTINQNSHFKSMRCRKVHIHRTSPGPVHYDGDPIETGEDIEVEIIPEGLKCVCPKSEGRVDLGTDIEGFFAEQFMQIYARSEMLIQDNIARGQKLGKMNLEMIKKITKKKK